MTKVNHIRKYQYFEIKAERQQYLGIRFFRWEPLSHEVVQISFAGGEPRRGRSDNFGVYHITTQTFFSNYLAMGYAVPCSQQKYLKKFKDVIKALA